MLCNISKLAIAVILLAFAAGCPSPPAPADSSSNEELRVLTPEQKKFLYDNAERVEKKERITQSITNDKGEVIGNSSSQTTVIYLKRAAGGGKFSVNNTCEGNCGGIPLNICPASSSCHCGEDTAGNCFCGTCQADGNCTGSCGKAKSIGFGNFGVFIAMDRDNPSNVSVAQK